MAYSITLSVQLKNNGATVLTGTQTLNNFTVNPLDVQTAKDFAKGDKLRQLITLMGWIATGAVIYGATQTITINDL